jgi:hypothetical protein
VPRRPCGYRTSDKPERSRMYIGLGALLIIIILLILLL